MQKSCESRPPEAATSAIVGEASSIIKLGLAEAKAQVISSAADMEDLEFGDLEESHVDDDESGRSTNELYTYIFFNWPNFKFPGNSSAA